MRELAAFVIVAVIALPSFAARAQTAKWNQEAVTTAAGELESAVSGLRDAVRKSTTWTTSPDQAELYEISQGLRQIEWLSTNLHADLKEGEGLAATLPEFNEILEARDYTRAEAAFVDISASIRPKLQAARAALAKLAVYYPKAEGP